MTYIAFFLRRSFRKRRNLLFALAGISLLVFIFTRDGSAAPLDFATFKLGADKGAVLIVGGIQGDEPGGFSAATLVATRYEIRKGCVWVVPNLNFPSIIKRSRGVHGDMNRKFLYLDEKDPEFATVRRIQDLIACPDVRLVLNLHDGSGYYRPVYEDKMKNPNRWGQSIIIDQERLDASTMGNLADLADRVAASANKKLLSPHHAINVRNTRTAEGDREMEKSLSYFAVRLGKAAFGLEATKDAPAATRAYYHLLMIEEFLRQSGVEFSRDFELTQKGVELALGENLGVAFADNRVFLPLDDARPSINSLPLPPRSDQLAITSKPIMAVLPCGKNNETLCVHYGNRTLARIKPEWRPLDNELSAMRVVVDGVEKVASFGQIVDVRKEAVVKKLPGYRVNAIGWDSGKKDESGLPLVRSKFKPAFSIDRRGNIFRVEVYKDKKFAGMFLIRFGGATRTAASRRNLPATPGKESSLGF